MRLRRGDIIVALILLAVAAAVAAAFLLPSRGKTGAGVEISVDGAVVRSIVLPANETVALDCGVTVVVDGAEAYVLSSDCPDRHCIRTGRISAPGQTAVCLPNRVIVRITGNGGPDVITG